MAKNQDGYQQVYQDLGGMFYGIILRAVGEECIAREVFTAVMVDVWDHIQEFDTAKMNLIQWIMARIVRPKILQYKSANQNGQLFS